MKIKIIKESELLNLKVNTFVIWTNRELNKFDTLPLRFIKKEDEFLYKQLRNKKTLENNNILFCSGIENKIDTYIFANIYYEGLTVENYESIINNINKVVNYIDLININSIVFTRPTIKLSNSSSKNNYLIYSSILKTLSKNKKIKTIYFVNNNDEEIKQIKRIIFLNKIPFLNKFI